MLKKIISIFFFLFILINPLFASVEDKIINNLIKTNNLTFNFKQTIGEKTEEGNCTIEYPKKIFCLYNNQNKKIMVSNGRSLVIKLSQLGANVILLSRNEKKMDELNNLYSEKLNISNEIKDLLINSPLL